jgi:tetratricopeptide (TPR) repeat protein
MTRVKRGAIWLKIALLLALAPAAAQETPSAFQPKRPLTRAELDRREALKLYARGLEAERDNRLLEACRLFEQAAKLDPDSVSLRKTLIPLYVALERLDDALAACRRAVEAEPNDFETWMLLSRLQRERGKLSEAVVALRKAVACPALRDHPVQQVQLTAELSGLCEEAQDLDGAAFAQDQLVQALEHPAHLIEVGALTAKEAEERLADAYERAGQLHLKRRDFPKAIDAFQKAQRKDADRARRLDYFVALVLTEQGRLDRALKPLDSYLATQPHGTEAYELKIRILVGLQRGKEVVPALRQHATRDPHNLALQLLLAQQLAKEGQTVEAEQRFLAVANESPSPEVYRGLFQLYFSRTGGMADAIQQLDRSLSRAVGRDGERGDVIEAAKARAMLVVLREDPALVKAILPIAERELKERRARSHETWRFLAVLAARTRQLEAAENLYRRCLEHLTPQNEAEIYGGLLRVLWEAKKLDEVVRLCRKGLKEAQATNRVLFHSNLALALVRMDKPDDALTEADKAIELADDETRFSRKLLRVDILRACGRFDTAIAEALQLLEQAVHPGDVRDARHALSNVYSAARQYDKAEEQLRRILEADPNDATANNDLGYIMADRGKNLPEAEELIRKAIELDRDQKKTSGRVRADDDHDNAAYLDSLGWVLFRRGDLDGARKYLEQAAALPEGADDPVVWDHLGDVHLKLGDIARARTAWRKAVQLYEQDRRRRLDDQYKDLQRKLRLLK